MKKSRFQLLLSVTAPAFALALSAGCASDPRRDHQEGDEPVTLTELPIDVRRILLAEIPGGSVTDLQKGTRDGQVVYIADTLVDGTAWGFRFTESGELILKKREKEPYRY
jgi:hypothetical protein